MKWLKFLVINFFWIFSIIKVYTIYCVFEEIHIKEKSGSWDMGQNTLNLSDCSIFISAISPAQIHEIAWFFES